jgi:hypothetical protein
VDILTLTSEYDVINLTINMAGMASYSLPTIDYIDYCGCSTRLLTLLNTDLIFQSVLFWCRYIYWNCNRNTSISSNAKVVINILVYLVYDYYNSSTMKRVDLAILAFLVASTYCGKRYTTHTTTVFITAAQYGIRISGSQFALCASLQLERDVLNLLLQS